MKRIAVAAAVVVLGLACSDQPNAPRPDQPLYAVSDGAHNGNPDFFFLPPMFKNPSNDPDFDAGAFNANLRPVVEICQLGDLQPDGTRSCIAGPPLRRFAGSEISVSAADQQYHVNWHTDESNLSTNQFYRISVFVSGAELGFADIDPVNTGKDLKNVQTGEYIGLVDGRTLPIKFRIENGALCDADDCAATTVNLPAGGGVELEADGERFRFDVEAGTQGTFGGQTITEVTFNVEVCDDIDVDLPKFGLCLRVTTFFDAGTAGQAELVLNNPVLISMCILAPGIPEAQEELISLHQQDGTLIRALPHAPPNCEAVGARTTDSPGLAVRAWRWMRDLAAQVITPKPLYAHSRTVLFDLGGGGQTDILGARCSGAETAMQMSLVECGAAVAPLRATTATAPTAKTVSDFQFALPAKMDYVNSDDASRQEPAGTSLATAVKVTDWNGLGVQGATVTFTIPAIEGPGTVLGTAVSNSNGIAQVSWPIASGPNTLVASGRGIAAQNNYPDATVFPFMPDIFATTPQVPVVLRTGAVPFAATGTLAALIDCQTTGATGGDQLDRGFYVPTYPGTSLGRVEMFFSADAAGDFTLSLTARANTYDGPVIGTATAAVTLPADRNTFVQGTFDFSSGAFAPGSAVTFALTQVTGPSTIVFYEVPSLGNEACPIVQTNGTEAPLSTVRRNGVEVRVFETPN